MKEIVEEITINFIETMHTDINKIIAFKFKDNVYVLTNFFDSKDERWHFIGLKDRNRFSAHSKDYKELINFTIKQRFCKIYQFDTYEEFAKWILEE